MIQFEISSDQCFVPALCTIEVGAGKERVTGHGLARARDVGLGTRCRILSRFCVCSSVVRSWLYAFVFMRHLMAPGSVLKIFPIKSQHATTVCIIMDVDQLSMLAIASLLWLGSLT